MNKVVLSGYIASDVELKQTNNGISYTRFSLAVKRPRSAEETDFLNIMCWRGTAEFVTKYFEKGSGIELSGIITTSKWQDENGNNRYSTEIVANEVDFGKKNKPKSNEQKNDDIIGSDDDFYELDPDIPF